MKVAGVVTIALLAVVIINFSSKDEHKDDSTKPEIVSANPQEPVKKTEDR